LRSSKFFPENVLVTGLATLVTCCDLVCVVSAADVLSMPWLVVDVVVVVVCLCSKMEMRSDIGRLPVLVRREDIVLAP
jgi:hypothetical protein